jgi:hypothetical protein
MNFVAFTICYKRKREGVSQQQLLQAWEASAFARPNGNLQLTTEDSSVSERVNKLEATVSPHSSYFQNQKAASIDISESDMDNLVQKDGYNCD